MGLGDEENGNGFVSIKGFSDDDSAIREAKSFNAIRTAFENLEDKLEFLQAEGMAHTFKQRIAQAEAMARADMLRF
ncbi:hypothetical protein ACET3Z_025731 [Daucus carota]